MRDKKWITIQAYFSVFEYINNHHRNTTMVKFLLKASAELSNVTGLEPSDTPEHPYEYTFQIECTNAVPPMIKTFR